MDNIFNEPLVPTEVGQRVRTRGYGGSVAMWMDWGTVVRFAKTGTPVVLVDDVPGRVATHTQVYDKFGVFRQVDEEGRWKK